MLKTEAPASAIQREKFFMTIIKIAFFATLTLSQVHAKDTLVCKDQAPQKAETLLIKHAKRSKLMLDVTTESARKMTGKTIEVTDKALYGNLAATIVPSVGTLAANSIRTAITKVGLLRTTRSTASYAIGNITLDEPYNLYAASRTAQAAKAAKTADQIRFLMSVGLAGAFAINTSVQTPRTGNKPDDIHDRVVEIMSEYDRIDGLAHEEVERWKNKTLPKETLSENLKLAFSFGSTNIQYTQILTEAYVAHAEIWRLKLAFSINALRELRKTCRETNTNHTLAKQNLPNVEEKNKINKFSKSIH